MALPSNISVETPFLLSEQGEANESFGDRTVRSNERGSAAVSVTYQWNLVLTRMASIHAN
jgi:hypothetical protein